MFEAAAAAAGDSAAAAGASTEAGGEAAGAKPKPGRASRTKRASRPSSAKARAKPAVKEEELGDLGDDVDVADDVGPKLVNLEAVAHRKRQRILQLATQLACESEDGERREAIIQLLMRETKDSARLASAMKSFPVWELSESGPVGGEGGAAQTDSALSSRGTEVFSSLPSPTRDEHEEGVDSVVQRLSRAVSQSEVASSGPSTSSSDGGGGLGGGALGGAEPSRGAAAGLKLDLRLLGGRSAISTIELSSAGDVLAFEGIGSPSAMASPMGTAGLLGLTPGVGTLSQATGRDAEDWFATAAAPADATALLSPLMTPSMAIACEGWH